jgi:hypothetical protein
MDGTPLITDLDTEVKAAQTPIVLTSAQIVVSKRLGEVVLKHYQ